MLKLTKINKSYKMNTTNQKVLNDITINFRKNEFVSILGPSGSGKTTLLNIIGGLDKYDSGDLAINNKSTKSFADKDYDAYRNSCIGFIFQNYNLINHLTIFENIEISLTLKGINKYNRKRKVLSILKEVGLIEYKNKYPNQLSGGQVQRVSIARALINNPKIILADEPTGALDSKTSVQIMELIKKISKDKLVIMVTHNKKLAQKYSNRIIELKDGHIISDNNPYNETNINNNVLIKNTSMNFLTALKVSFKNIITKKTRTLLIAIASSIGIMGLAIILALSNGMNKQLKLFEQNTLSNLPIMIEKEVIDLTVEEDNTLKDYPNNEQIYKNSKDNLNIHYNNINNSYLEYINELNDNLYNGITYQRNIQMNTLIKTNNKVSSINLSNNFILFPLDKEYINSYYDILKGKLPNNKNELILVVDSKNSINENIIKQFKLDQDKEITFNDFMNINLAISTNNNYYEKINNYFKIRDNLNEVYNNSLKLKIVGIIRIKKEKADLIEDTSGIVYTNDLMDYILKENGNSDIVNFQKKANYNVLTGIIFKNKEDKEILLKSLGETTIPEGIYIYPKDFESKTKIIKYLDNYDQDKIVYIDQAETFTTILKNIISTITLILIAFSCISLIISSIMIGIITYISVLERKKEIGILRALGARKKDIKRIFTAETFIIGLTSGIIGILIVLILKYPINKIIYNLTSLNNVVSLSLNHIILLITISISLTIIGGLIPAKYASKKRPIEVLKTE